jgi:hypothetical protein
MKQLWEKEILELQKQLEPLKKKKEKTNKKKKELNCTLRMEEPEDGWSGIV